MGLGVLGIVARVTAAGVRAARARTGSFIRRNPGVTALAVGGAVTTAAIIASRNSSSVAIPDPFKEQIIKFPNDLGMYGNYISFRAFSTTGTLEGTITSALGALGMNGFWSGLKGEGATIHLPLPNNLKADFDPQYSSKDLGSNAAAIGLKYADRGIYGNNGPGAGNALAAAGISAIGSVAGAAASAMADAGKFDGPLAKALGEMAGGGNAADTGAAALKVGAGVALNPHKILLFTGVDFRKHQFSWRLSPRNQRESDQIQNILKILTYYAHPNFVAGGLYLKYPEFFDIQFYRNGYLYKFLPAVIDSISIDYQPTGYAAYKRGDGNQNEPAPAEVQLSIQFQETEIITKESLVSSLATNASINGPMNNVRTGVDPLTNVRQTTTPAGPGGVLGSNVPVTTNFGTPNPNQ